jgi:putative flippase GtrA
VESSVARVRSRAGHALRRPANWFQLAKFALAAYAANLALLAALIHLAGLDKVLAQAIAIVLVTPLNFVGNKLWSFR